MPPDNPPALVLRPDQQRRPRLLPEGLGRGRGRGVAGRPGASHKWPIHRSDAFEAIPAQTSADPVHATLPRVAVRVSQTPETTRSRSTAASTIAPSTGWETSPGRTGIAPLVSALMITRPGSNLQASALLLQSTRTTAVSTAPSRHVRRRSVGDCSAGNGSSGVGLIGTAGAARPASPGSSAVPRFTTPCPSVEVSPVFGGPGRFSTRSVRLAREAVASSTLDGRPGDL